MGSVKKYLSKNNECRHSYCVAVGSLLGITLSVRHAQIGIL